MVIKVWSGFLNYVYYPAVKYRIHISLIFLFLIINAFTRIAKIETLWPVAIAWFSWHFALYIFDRAWDFDKDAITQPEEAIRPKERKFWLIVSVVLCLAPLVILPAFGFSVVPYLPFIPVTFLYTFPLFKGIRSKNITLFKNFYSAAFIWTLPLCVILIFYADMKTDIWVLYKENFLGMFLYAMVGEAFWDIRDLEGDRLEKVWTLPNVIGVVPTKIYLYALIGIDYFLFGHLVTDSTIIYAILIAIVTPDTPRWVFHLPPLLALYRFLKPLFIS